ncbi:Proteolipid protein DM beta [Oryzias melastigma]|uniref:Proteolipid protein DM beta n=1 Tax=Oryzias melastigma TaxID=30732 RepID=A0A834CDA5_ORYME|nr:Proteolipid protein DM beta [Oryzias melastigma]
MEEDMDEGQSQKGCLECCIKCLGGIPYPSLVATILLYAGVALFCGCGHEALSGTVTILQNYFEVVRSPVDALDVFTMIDIIKYVIYGIASAFFVYGILLMVEGFFTSGAIKDLYGDFKITTCGRCVSAWFIMLTYIFMLAWLGVTAFTSIPVFLYFNIWNICQNATVLDGTELCLDPRQYGIVPIAEAKTVCAGSEKFYKMCESNELDMTFHLFICALAGAGAAVIAMVSLQTHSADAPALQFADRWITQESCVGACSLRGSAAAASSASADADRGFCSRSCCLPDREKLQKGETAFWRSKTEFVCLPFAEAGAVSCSCHGNREKKGSEIVVNNIQ